MFFLCIPITLRTIFCVFSLLQSLTAYFSINPRLPFQKIALQFYSSDGNQSCHPCFFPLFCLSSPPLPSLAASFTSLNPCSAHTHPARCATQFDNFSTAEVLDIPLAFFLPPLEITANPHTKQTIFFILRKPEFNMKLLPSK